MGKWSLEETVVRGTSTATLRQTGKSFMSRMEAWERRISGLRMLVVDDLNASVRAMESEVRAEMRAEMRQIVTVRGRYSEGDAVTNRGDTVKLNRLGNDRMSGG